MPAPNLLCAALEIALNRVLRAEPAALRRCPALAGKTLAIVPGGLGWRFVIEIDTRGVRVSSDDRMPCDVSVQAPTLRLAALALRNDAEGVGAVSGLDVRGDAELLRQFAELLKTADFDLEEWLAPVVGGAPAHRMVQGLHGFASWLHGSAQELAFSGAEYLREETGDLARAADVADWLSGVETLREHLDRAEARLQLLENHA
ncbi:MAG: hypothetical protein EPN72_07925 [Nevskiaceae bacterium]|nr:MAG: hypothetical protein EPN63_04685 [Nevskiaceae bacterium]TBR73085.1 MAG: hypothetical protein EPN72_07925 [Nevskiaceae bacterium]